MNAKSLLRLNGDRFLALVLVVAGVLALIIGWFGISGKALAAQQLPYLISGGLGGIVLVTLGCTLGISADLQDEWRQMERVEHALHELVAERELHSAEAVEVAPSTNGSGPAKRTTTKAEA